MHPCLPFFSLVFDLHRPEASSTQPTEMLPSPAITLRTKTILSRLLPTLAILVSLGQVLVRLGILGNLIRGWYLRSYGRIALVDCSLVKPRLDPVQASGGLMAEWLGSRGAPPWPLSDCHGVHKGIVIKISSLIRTRTGTPSIISCLTFRAWPLQSSLARLGMELQQ